MHRKLLIVAVVALAVASAGFAQQKPNFSGTWKLDVNKSDFGPVPGPSSETDIIEQNGDIVTIKVAAAMDEGTHQYTIKYVADGKEVNVSQDAPAAHPAPGATMQSIAVSWDGSVLVVSQKLTYEDSPVTGISRYSLSPDAKVLTVDSSYASQMGDATRTFIYEKADASAAPPESAPLSNKAAASTPPSPGAASSGAASAAAAEKPNLSGIWVLDLSKSDFGQMPPPDSRTDTIEHKDPSVKITVNQTGQMGEMTFTMDLLTDGKTVAKWAILGNEASSTAHWDGNSLVVKTDSKFQDDPVTFVSTYTLGPDGKTLNVQDHISGPMGDGDWKMVFNKR